MHCSDRPAPLELTADLERVIQPLASYICSADRPRTALRRALAALAHEVRETNRAATAQCREFPHARCA